MLLMATLILSGCGQLMDTPNAGKLGTLMLQFTIPGESGISTQALRSPIASYEVVLNGPSAITETFPNNGAPISIQVKEGIWTVNVTAIDERGVRAYSGTKTEILIDAGTVTDVALVLNPNPANVTFSVDISSLFAAGYNPSQIRITWLERGIGVDWEVEKKIEYYVTSSQPITTKTALVTTTRTYDFKFVATTSSGGVIAENALTDYAAWPGEEVSVTWLADAPGVESGIIVVSGTIATPMDTPTNLAAEYNPATSGVDVTWTAPTEPLSIQYILEYQLDERTPYKRYTPLYPDLLRNTTNISINPGHVSTLQWRGKTIKLRLSCQQMNGYDYTSRASIATNPVTVEIPAL